jgi:hypothetical protein
VKSAAPLNLRKFQASLRTRIRNSSSGLLTEKSPNFCTAPLVSFSTLGKSVKSRRQESPSASGGVKLFEYITVKGPALEIVIVAAAGSKIPGPT